MSAPRAPGSVLLSLLALISLPAALPAAPVVRAPEMPTYLPRYHLDIDIDVGRHLVHARMEATWTNPHRDSTDQLVFNAHSRYVVPADQIGFTAKMLEILRMTPSEAMGIKEPPLLINRVTHQNKELGFRFEGD